MADFKGTFQDHVTFFFSFIPETQTGSAVKHVDYKPLVGMSASRLINLSEFASSLSFLFHVIYLF